MRHADLSASAELLVAFALDNSMKFETDFDPHFRVDSLSACDKRLDFGHIQPK